MDYIPVKDRRTSLKYRSLHRKSVPASLAFLLNYFPVCETAEKRQAVCSLLVRDLCEHFGIRDCNVVVYDKQSPAIRGRKKKGHSRMYLRGQYVTWDDDSTPTIELWNLMATGRKRTWLQNLSILLHEFIHHYDSCHLSISSGHDSGFQARLLHLTKMIRSVKRKRRSAPKSMKRK